MDFNKLYRDHALRRKLILGSTVAVAGGIYVLHRNAINAAISAQQDISFDTAWSSYNEGIKYGLTLAKQGVTEVGPYLFDGFDKKA